jgi:hypothetical protein
MAEKRAERWGEKTSVQSRRPRERGREDDAEDGENEDREGRGGQGRRHEDRKGRGEEKTEKAHGAKRGTRFKQRVEGRGSRVERSTARQCTARGEKITGK